MYAKVFAQIFDSSIANDYRLRQFFIDLLVLAEWDGTVDMTQEAIAARTRIPLEQVTSMLLELEQPDARSRSKAEEGRRLIRLDQERDWGWKIVNYEHYRDIRNEEERKVYKRNWMRHKREQKRGQSVDSGGLGGPIKKQIKIHKKKEDSAGAVVYEEKSPAKQFTELWCAGYEKHFKQKYVFQGPKDGAALKRLFGPWPVDKAYAVAESAWTLRGRGYWACDNCTASIASFESGINKIIGELKLVDEKKTNESNKRSNPRNIGVAKGPTNYGEAARRKQARQEMVGQVDRPQGDASNNRTPGAGSTTVLPANPERTA